MMLRLSATRQLLKGSFRASTARSSYTAASAKFRTSGISNQLAQKRPQAIVSPGRPTTTALLYATKSDGPPFDYIDTKKEEKLAGEKLIAHPDQVNSGSSTRHTFEHGQAEASADDAMMGGMRSDLKTIKETFSLTEVPRDILILGGAGVLPYAATSLSTVYLAYEINHASSSGSGYLFTPELAHQLLDLVTPIQIGYGAVIISFLGALHWGVEMAGYGGHHSFRRYLYGVAAPAVAWPTIFMPVEYALITQFFAFNFLYFADARASVRGWFPPWYSIYRFVLTFFVGASIVFSLVGRGQIAKHDHTLRSAVDYVKADKDAQWEALEKEEMARRKALAKEEEGEDKGEEDTEEGEGEKEEDKEGDDE